MVCSAKTCLNKMLAITNILAGLSGLGILVIGSLAMYEALKFSTVPLLKFPCVILICLGGVALLLVMFEHCGRKKESYYMTTLYYMLMMPIVVIESTIGGILMGFKKEVRSLIEIWMDRVNSKIEIKTSCDTMLLIEKLGRCCGVEGPIDYQKYSSMTTDPCLHNGNFTCPANQQGCMTLFEPNIIFIAGIILLIVAGLQFLATFYAYMFSTKLRYYPKTEI